MDSGFRKNRTGKKKEEKMQGKGWKFASGAVIGMAAACLLSGMDMAVAEAAYGVTYNCCGQAFL